MTNAIPMGLEPRYEVQPAPEANASGVSWAAVAGGAFISSALSLILLSLGAGLGLSSVSPWSNVGATAAAVGTASILWLIGMQVISSAMGGYLAGRLRTKWTSTHDDEVYFRDTAHGLLVWAVGLVITASFLTASAASMVGGSYQQAAAAKDQLENTYFVDTLFRTDKMGEYDESARAEAGRIFTAALQAKEISAADRAYLSQMIEARTSVNHADADRRISETLAAARQAVDTARKATAHALLWMFIALLIGAFCASYAATLGGRQRDHMKAI